MKKTINYLRVFYRKLMCINLQRRIESSWLLSEVNISCEDLVLDLGCGNGQFTKLLKRKVNYCVAMDIDKEQVKYAKLHNSGALYVVGSSDSLPFKTSVFDKVYSRCSLQQFPKQHESFKEVERVLEVNGNFLFTADSLSHKFISKRYLEWHSRKNKTYAKYNVNDLKRLKDYSLNILNYEYLFSNIISARILVFLSLFKRAWLWAYPITAFAIAIDKIRIVKPKAGLRILANMQRINKNEKVEE